MTQKNNKSTLLKEPLNQKHVEKPAGSQIGHKRIPVYTDERNLKTWYANSFRTTATAEEILLDFGMNHVQLLPQKDGEVRMVFHSDNRIVMNYYSAKRLAMTLSNIIRRHEQEFGELELNAKKRRSGSNSNCKQP